MADKDREHKKKTREVVESENEEETNDSSSEEDDDERIPIDLSENEIYRGICTLFEDEEGNNILEYISLLHTELIGINKSLENLKLIRKDITRLADCAEIMFKGKKVEQKENREQTREQTTDVVSKRKSKSEKEKE
jgi:hypothetical protein